MISSKKNWRRIIPGVIISAISLAIVLYIIDLDQFLEAMRLANYSLVALYFLITLLWLLVRTAVWRTLLQEKATPNQVFLTINEGYLLNNILPFRLGEVGRAFLLSRKANLQFLQVLSTIVVERALDIAIAAGILLSTLPFVVGASWAFQAAIFAGTLVLIGLGILYLLARHREWTVRQFERLTTRWPALLGGGSKQLDAFLSGLVALNQGKRFLQAIVLMILNWTVSIGQYYVLLSAFFPNTKLLWVTFGLGVLALGIAVPSSPGAVGVMELSMVGALSLFGLDPSTSLAAAVTAHITNYIVTGVIGAYALFRDGLTLSGLYREVQHVSSLEDSGLQEKTTPGKDPA